MGYNRSFRKHTRRRRRGGLTPSSVTKPLNTAAETMGEKTQEVAQGAKETAQNATHAVTEGAEKGQAAVESWFGKLTGLFNSAPASVKGIFAKLGFKGGRVTLKRIKVGDKCPNCPCGKTQKSIKGGKKKRRTYKK